VELLVRSEGREERVTLENHEGRLRACVGERTYLLDRAGRGPAWSLIVDGVQSELVVLERARSAGSTHYWVSEGGRGCEVAVFEPLAFLAQRGGVSSGAGTAAVVKAYMPGRVVSVLLAEGAAVRRGQGVVVLEAMKMENEILAESDGVLAKVWVEPGQAVEGGDPLFELAPATEPPPEPNEHQEDVERSG
jgi:biotin carboxyl carrier protein